MTDSSQPNRLTGLANLKARPKGSVAEANEEARQAERVGESLGFVDRGGRKKPGRKPSPRTYQLHPRVLPRIGEAITAEAERRGLTQGQMIEHLWDAYQRP